MFRLSCLLALAISLCAALALGAEGPKKVVFVSGPKDHGRPDRHEYQKDLTVLKYCLDHSSNVKNIATQLYAAPAPDVAELKDASVIVLESSGDRIPRERHALLPQDATTDHKSYDAATMERLNQFDALMKKGVGLVSIHYSTWVNNETGRRFWLDWLGGVADYVQDDSKVRVADWSMSLVSPQHPILRGIRPWTYEHEEFFTKELMPEDPRRTPLLAASAASFNGGEANVISWAVERQGGGRGFVFTGSDFHQNMANELHRRILTNGIVWAAGMEVPKGGVTCEVPEDVLK